MNLYRLEFYDTDSDNKYDAQEVCEYLGDNVSIFRLWFYLAKVLNKKHIEIYTMDGIIQHPENGLGALG
jgi:hypothetical protein